MYMNTIHVLLFFFPPSFFIYLFFYFLFFDVFCCCFCFVFGFCLLFLKMLQESQRGATRINPNPRALVPLFLNCESYGYSINTNYMNYHKTILNSIIGEVKYIRFLRVPFVFFWVKIMHRPLNFYHQVFNLSVMIYIPSI